jgi:hypothetical protein
MPRPIALEALNKMFELFKRFKYNYHDTYFVSIEGTLAITEKHPKAIEKIIKMMKISNEKDPAIPIFPLIVQSNIK